MANIRNSISLHDRMTPVFRSIIKSMDSTLRVMKNLDRQANNGVQSKAYQRAERDIVRANNALLKMKNNLTMAERGANGLSNATGSVSRNMSSLGSFGFNLVNLSAALYLFTNIKDTLADLMEKPDLARATQARLGLFNESPYSNEQLYEAVYRTALNTRSGLAETGNLATRILISGAMKGEGSAVGAVKATELINKTLIAGGGTAGENDRSLLQLSQALSSGMLQGDELRAIREQAPYLANTLALGLRKIEPDNPLFANADIGSLKALGAQGELTSDRILKAFFAMEDEIGQAFNQMPKTFGQAMTQMNSMWQYFLYILSTGEGPLKLINDRIWALFDYLGTDKGLVTLNKLGNAINIFVTSVLWGIDRIIDAINWMNDNANIAYSLFVGLGTVAAVAAAQMMVAWAAAIWPIALAVAIIGALNYALLELGFTGEQIAGGWGGVLTKAFYNVWQAVYDVYNVFRMVVIVLDMVWKILMTIAEYIAGGITSGLSIASSAFMQFGNDALDILGTIGDKLQSLFNFQMPSFMTNIADKARNVLGFVENSSIPYMDAQDGRTAFKDFTGGIFPGLRKTIDKIMDPNTFNPNANGRNNFASGSAWGKDLFNDAHGYSVTAMQENIEKVEGILAGWNPNTVTMKGGHLDSLDSIKQKVNIAEEDIKLLRDMAAREFLVNISNIAPQVNATFGDVRETADVNDILTQIEKLVEEARGASLITEGGY